MIKTKHILFYLFDTLRLLLLAACFQFLTNVAYSQDTTTQSPFTPLTQEIIGLKPALNAEETVSITNLNDINIKEAPGCVYVITSVDIERFGYTDLLDALMDVPGFNIASDVQNGIALALRGFWAEEAKILFMVDGLQMNDMAYGSFILYGRFPLANVERIEIIKGAGSSIYGGQAGMGVINIITKSGKKNPGSTYTLLGGFSNNAVSRLGANFTYASYLLNGVELSVSGGVFDGNRSNQILDLPDTTRVNFRDSSRVNNVYVKLKLKYKSLEYNIIYDDYNFQATYEPISSLARTLNTNVKYKHQFKGFSLTPYAALKSQLPWNTQYGDPLIYDLQNLSTRRINGGIENTTVFFKRINFLSAIEVYSDYYKHYRYGLALKNGKISDVFMGYAGFAEIDFKTKYFHLFAGARFDKYNLFKGNFSPRFSITKSFPKWNYKLIYGESFKIPALQNINLDVSGRLVPEKIKDLQAELGFLVGKSEIIFNAFYTRASHIIVFDYDLITFLESYRNKGNMDIDGCELQFKTTVKNFHIRASYSLYNLLDFTFNDYVVDTLNKKLGTIAIPKHKANLNLAYTLNKRSSFVMSLTYQSSKHSFERVSVTTDEYALIKRPATLLLDLTYQLKKVFLKNTNINFGVRNALNTKNYYLYASGTDYFPVIGMGREFYIQVKTYL